MRHLGVGFLACLVSAGLSTGCATAYNSRWPIEAAWKLPLPHPSRILRQARAAVAARVRIGSHAVRVYSLHFGSPLGINGRQRRAQADVVLADARGSADPVIIGGDLNSKGLGRAFVAAGYRWATEHVGGTRGWLSFDHVFTRGLGPAQSAAGVARDVHASDHRPVWAVIPFAPAR